MSRPLINRILLGIFILVMLSMVVVYARQERQISDLQKEQQELELKREKIEFLIQEYKVLIDSVDSRNFIIRMAREKFGWVFDNEKVYIKIDSLLNPSQTPTPQNSPSPDISVSPTQEAAQ